MAHSLSTSSSPTGFSGHSREASASRHKRRRSPDGSPRSPGRETRNRGRKVKPRAAPAGERGHDKPERSGARRPHERTGGRFRGRELGGVGRRAQGPGKESGQWAPRGLGKPSVRQEPRPPVAPDEMGFKFERAERKAPWAGHRSPQDAGRGQEDGVWRRAAEGWGMEGSGRRGREGLWDLGNGSPSAPRSPSDTSRSVSRAGSVPSPRRLEEPKHRPRSPGRISGPERRVDDREELPTSPKRRRRLSPEAWVSLPCPLSRVVNHLGGLEVALGELRAPGGAFLPGPAGGTQPGASQRAWLAWQLAHAGAALHWALATLDNLLAAGPLPAGPPAFAPAPGRPQVRTGASTVALEKLEPSAPEAIPTLHCKLYGALQGGGLLRWDARCSQAAAEQKEAWPRPSSAPGSLPPASSGR